MSAFVLNFVWEMAQMPLYATRMTIRTCLWAAGGDIALTLTALAFASVLARGRRLVFSATFALLLIAAAASVEGLALPAGRWSYAAGMPTVAGVGLVPLIQLLMAGAGSLWLAGRIRSRQPAPGLREALGSLDAGFAVGAGSRLEHLGGGGGVRDSATPAG